MVRKTVLIVLALCVILQLVAHVFQQTSRQLVDAEEDASHGVVVSTRPDPNQKTVALFSPLQWGFRNQCMAFTYFILQGMNRKFSQVLLPSITFEDFYGIRRRVAFESIFDVDHWNSYHPALPRLVSYDPHQHFEWNTWRMALVWLQNYRSYWNPADGLSKPYAFGSMTDLLHAYKSYTAGVMDGRLERHPAELLILQGALRPHPDLQQLIDRIATKFNQKPSLNNQSQLLLRGGTPTTIRQLSKDDDNDYMALHARVEPDIQSHVFCPWAKITNLTRIFEILERDFPEPPASRLFIAINRPLLEQYGSNPTSENTIAVDNLRALNQAVANGLWNGRIQVFEAGRSALQGTRFEARPGVFSAVVDYFLAVQSKVFIGTEISSFSMDVVSTRFYRGNNKKSNYLYMPEGIKPATPEGTVLPPRFNC